MRDPRWYLGVGLAGILLLLLLGAVVPGLAVGPTYLADIVAIAALIAMVVLWLMCRSDTRLSIVQRVFLGGGFLAWAICVVHTLTEGNPTQPALLLMGALLGLSMLRPVSGREATGLLDLFALGVVGTCAIALVLEIAGVIPSWYALRDLGDLQASERASYWIPLVDVLGLDGRWAGPFDHPGRAGEVAALLVVWGVTRRGWLRIVLVASGLVFVLLAGSNTAYLSLAFGIAAVVVVAVLRRATQLPRWIVWVVSGGAVLAVVSLIVLIVGPNTGLTGRTFVWPIYVDLWRGSPWTGIGDQGIGAAQATGLLPNWAYHAHNSWLDLLVRHGVLVLALSVASIVGAMAAVARYARTDSAGPLAMLTVLLVASITQPMVVWLLPTVPMVMLTLGVLATSDPVRPGQEHESGAFAA